MILDTIKNLIKKGDYDEALQKIASLPKEECVAGMVLKSGLFRTQGNFQEALRLAEDAVTESRVRKDRLVELDAFIELASALIRLGQLDEGLVAVETGEKLIETIALTTAAAERGKTQKTEAKLLNIKGILYLQKGDLEQSKEYLQKSLAINESLGDRLGVAKMYNNLGVIYSRNGDLEQAVECYRNCITICDKLGNRLGLLANSYNNLGIIYHIKGELEQAMEYWQKSLAINESLGDRDGVASSYHNIGVVFRNRGEMEEAQSWLNRALKLKKSFGNDIRVANTVFELFQTSLALRDDLSAASWVTTLEDIANRTANKRVILEHRLAQALLLKQSKRVRQKVQAQILLEEIVVGEVVNYELTIIATRHLCELLLEELKSYGEAEVLDEVKALINKMYKLGQDQRSFVVVVDALVLKAKFALLEGQTTTATQFLDQAVLIAKEKGLTLLQKTAQREQQNLVTQLDSWKDLVTRNASMYERIEHTRLEEYLAEAQRLVNLHS